MSGELVFHQWLGSEKQLSVTVEKGMAGKYAYKIGYGGRIEDRDDIIRVLEEVDRQLTERFGSQQAA
jgi:hypothetical protein